MNSQLTRNDYLKAWLLFFVLATTGGIIAGALAGGVLGFCLGVLGSSTGTLELMRPTIQLGCQFAGFIAAMPVSFGCYMWTAKKLVQKVEPGPAATT